MEPGSGMQTAPKTAPDFTQKEIHIADGHIVKYKGADGAGFVRSYKNGKKDGITAIYKNGVLYGEKSYKNGVLHGLSRNYYFPLTLLDVYYVDGKKHGVAKEWCDGREKLKSQEHYNMGTLDGLSEAWSCDDIHSPEWSTEYKKGKKDGMHKIYYKGKFNTIAHYKNGKKDGIYKDYHHNGKLATVATYKNGVRHGSYKFWDHTGKLVSEIIYKNGRGFDMNGNYIPIIKEK
jgi:antitoxin component YwqK of YwqJK toxin-antitoxin module